MAGALLEFIDLTKRYGSVTALDRFNLTVAPGEFVTFLGPSGSGKTTALNLLAGFASATDGDVRIAGQSVLALPPEKRNVGMVFQSYSLFPHLSVFENVAFPLRLRRVAKAEVTRRVEEALAMVQLADFAGRMPNELSGGQRQRVAFARAVVFEPPVLLMDEPLAALDLKLREQMQFEIRRYHQALGCTIIFVTHDQGEALTLSDRVAVMRDGYIVQTGTPQEIYDAPQSQYVAEFIGTTNLFDLAPNGCDLPELAATLPAAVLEGKLSVRPEKLRPVAPDGADVTFRAVLSQVVFQGDHTLYEAQLAGGRTVTFRTHRGPGVAALSRGAEVTLGFDLDDSVPVVPETGKTAGQIASGG